MFQYFSWLYSSAKCSATDFSSFLYGCWLWAPKHCKLPTCVGESTMESCTCKSSPVMRSRTRPRSVSKSVLIFVKTILRATAWTTTKSRGNASRTTRRPFTIQRTWSGARTAAIWTFIGRTARAAITSVTCVKCARWTELTAPTAEVKARKEQNQ